LYLAGLLSNFTVCFVSGRRLLYPRELCRMARYLQPAMLVFEDIDLIAQERDSNSLSTVLGELMNQIDECEPGEQVLFIMNTNSLERLERAVRNRPGRVDQIVDVPLPDAEGRKRLLKLFSKGFSPEEAELERVAGATEGATPATLKEAVKRAAVMAVARVGVGRTAAHGLRVRAEDLLLAYEQVGRMRGGQVEA
jgi:ATP-dependent 26S proteasome regulatory subunit